MPKHEVYVKIEIPNGKLCNGKSEHCDYLQWDDFEPFCCVFQKEVITDYDSLEVKRLPECLKLDKGRICINCGNYGMSWCELHCKEVLTSDTCEDFVYGSWK